MAAGSKKKKKAAANPARGFATVSTQSKSKSEATVNVDEQQPVQTNPEDQSHIATDITSKESTKQDVKDLSPEELEAQLEQHELQQLVENLAPNVKKEAARHVSRLRTEKRVLRESADYLSVKTRLSDELMHRVIDLTLSDVEHDQQSRQKVSIRTGDDLTTKVWGLCLMLRGLDVSEHCIIEVITSLLHHPPPAEQAGQIWGLSEALDWLALNAPTEEQVNYDERRTKTIVESADEAERLPDHHSGNNVRGASTERKSELNGSDTHHVASPAGGDTDAVVSDIDGDLEPDELLSVYLSTKAKLYDLNPSYLDLLQKKKKSFHTKNGGSNATLRTAKERNLQRKLQQIESDVLFDQQQADLQWSHEKLKLIRLEAERKKLNLPGTSGPNDHTSTPSSATTDSSSQETPDDSGTEDLLGGMFDSLPNTGSARVEEDGNSQAVTIRDFGRTIGMTPRRVFEEACRSRDSRCSFTYIQVSPTTYACRHRLTVQWTNAQKVQEPEYLQSFMVKTSPQSFSITSINEATPDVSQSEYFVATAALFTIFAGSTKEEKVHLKLPSAYRDLWDEFIELKREHDHAMDRAAIKDVQDLIKKNVTQDLDSEDEIVFSAASRRLNGHVSGTSSPATRPLTPRPMDEHISDMLRNTWNNKFSSPAYQNMLVERGSLPMTLAKQAVLDAIHQNQITIVVGDTGSGKSTQVPQFILENELSNGRPCKLYCTEPRRISAISLAQRVSQELGERRNDLGTNRSLVGYAIRLESYISNQTRLVFATVGIVLRMLESSDGLGEITHLILDEVHERNIDTDFLLIVVRSLLHQRPDLKVILMSATVDAQKFSKYLDGAPVVEVPGRTFPVKALFLEDAIELTSHTIDKSNTVSEADGDDLEPSDHDKSISPSELSAYSRTTIDTLMAYDEYKIDHELIVKLLYNIAFDPNSQLQSFSQAILIFVPGIQDIHRLNDMILGHPAFRHGWRVHTLHSTFSSEDQQAAFEIPPSGTRKIVIATNIAETGITIPDITCVIDTGKHREMRFDERRQMSRLIQSFIAKANAKQRRGRAGRVQEGVCFHLFTKHRFENIMAEQQTPEMLRLSLQDLVMRVKICKLGNIEATLSDALDPPSSRNIRRAIDALIGVGALTTSEQLTTLGHQLAKLPLDAQLGKLILFGTMFGCLDFTLTIAAALSSKSPFRSTMHNSKQADTVRHGFKRGDSDLLTLYNAYSAWRKVCTTPGLSEFQFCHKNFLNAQNLANIEDLKAQLLTSLLEVGIVDLDPSERAALSTVKPGSRKRNFVVLSSKYCRADGNDNVTSSVVAWAFYPKIIKQEGKGWRSIANNQTLAVHPTSVNRHNLSPGVKYLSFYSIMQSSSRFTNAQETTAVSDFTLVLLGGDATFHMYAGVIVLDNNRLKFKVKDWKTMIALKTLRLKLKQALDRMLKYPGRELGLRLKNWLDLGMEILEQKSAQ